MIIMARRNNDFKTACCTFVAKRRGNEEFNGSVMQLFWWEPLIPTCITHSNVIDEEINVRGVYLYFNGIKSNETGT